MKHDPVPSWEYRSGDNVVTTDSPAIEADAPPRYDPLRVQRRTYLFTGHVQGVGFRYTAQEIASRHAVTGFVRNLPDRRVELVMEGAEGEMDAVVEALQQQMGQFIRKIDQTTGPATGEFNDFHVRH